MHMRLYREVWYKNMINFDNIEKTIGNNPN